MRQFSVSTLYRVSLGMVVLVALAFALNGPITGAVGAQTGGGGAVLVGRLDGAIDPISARTLSGWLEDAAERDAALFVLELDTPGGAADAMRDMTGAILESSVPVAVIVTPAGARAASAGTFIVSAAHVSAMSPGTTIGAASPVDADARDLGETIKEKVSQDVAALIRGIANQRGRSPDAVAALEATIFEAKSYSAQEAADAGIVDLMARDVPDLLAKIDGMVVNVRGTDVALGAAGATPQSVSATPVQTARGWLANPTLVFLLLAAGGVLILVEAISPGGWVAGVSGATLIALAIIGLVSLPVNWIGLILIAAGLGLDLLGASSARMGRVRRGGRDSDARGRVLPVRRHEPAGFAGAGRPRRLRSARGRGRLPGAKRRRAVLLLAQGEGDQRPPPPGRRDRGAGGRGQNRARPHRHGAGGERALDGGIGNRRDNRIGRKRGGGGSGRAYAQGLQGKQLGSARKELVMIPYLRTVKQYERLAVFTLGKYSGLKGPGLNVLFWPFHKTEQVDLREEVLDIPRQTNITLDNAPIDIDFLVYMRVIDGQEDRAVLEVVDYYGAVVGIATTTLRAVIGEMNVDDVLSQRERINEALRTKLDEITARWGIKVTQVEIREIEPARDIQEAMNRQMSAERLRRAEVIEAEGTRQAAITVAEGEKQAAILRAEGHRQSEILTAEGDQQAAVLRAEGFSTALEKISGVAETIDSNTLSLQYFDTLKSLGASDSTKFIFPMEFTRLLSPFVDAATGNGQRSDGD